MDTLKLNGKEYKVRLTWKGYRKLLKSPEFKKNADGIYPAEEIDKISNQSIERLWEILVRRWYGLKPFLWKGRMERKITAVDVIKSNEKVTELMTVEDKESGN